MGKRDNIRRNLERARDGRGCKPADVAPIGQTVIPPARAWEAAARRQAIERGRVAFLDAADDMLGAGVLTGGGNA